MMTMLNVMLERHGRQLPVVNEASAYAYQALAGNQSRSVQQGHALPKNALKA